MRIQSTVEALLALLTVLAVVPGVDGQVPDKTTVAGVPVIGQAICSKFPFPKHIPHQAADCGVLCLPGGSIEARIDRIADLYSQASALRNTPEVTNNSGISVTDHVRAAIHAQHREGASGHLLDVKHRRHNLPLPGEWIYLLRPTNTSFRYLNFPLILGPLMTDIFPRSRYHDLCLLAPVPIEPTRRLIGFPLH